MAIELKVPRSIITDEFSQWMEETNLSHRWEHERSEEEVSNYRSPGVYIVYPVLIVAFKDEVEEMLFRLKWL